MMNLLQFIILIFVSNVHSLTDIGKLNLVKVNLPNVGYKRLTVSNNGHLSAPPLAVLDAVKLENYTCFKNIRSNRWTLGIPIIFWNETYMSTVTDNIKLNEFFKKFQTNLSELILPPCDILAYRLNWRRRYELFDESLIYIDSFWYNSAADYVLPKGHTFIMEFRPSNDTEATCKEIKRKLLRETLQSQELTVDFVVRNMKKRTIPPVKISIGDIKQTKMYNDTVCDGKDKCFVSYEYAEKWSFEVSTNIMRGFNIIHLNLQKDIYDAILNNYLCKDKVPISQLETIKKLTLNPNNEMGCKVPEKVFTTVTKVCATHSVYLGYHSGYKNEVRCNDRAVDFTKEIVSRMDQGSMSDDKSEFTIPVKRF